MSVHLNGWLKLRVLFALSFLLLLPSVLNAQDKFCTVVPEGTDWNCPFSSFKTGDRLVFKELNLDDALKSAQTQEQAFIALEAAYTKFGNLNDFADWLRAQGFDVSPMSFPPFAVEVEQVDAIKIIFDSAYWELFDGFWSSLSRSLGNQHSRLDLEMQFYTNGRFKNIGTVSAN